jgi:N-acylneuraminate cytidylyltransferase
MSNVAIIPARKGSKRIPLKNIKPFLGKPIMAYSIEAALNSGLFDEVMVSTDDAEIAKVAIEYGAKVPFLRSSKNSDDFTSSKDVMLEVIDEYEKRGMKFNIGCCVYATAPFLTVDNLQKAYSLLKEKKFDTVLPLLKFNYPIQRALYVTDGKIVMINKEHLNTRSQDLPHCYHDSGQFFWFDVKTFQQKQHPFTDNSGAIIISDMEAQDIDDLADWQLAELKYQLVQQLKSIGNGELKNVSQ